MDIDFSDTQSYIQHFHAKNCDLNIVNNMEGIFNLCFYLLSEVDRLALEIDKKTINIARLKDIVFDMKSFDDGSNNESNEPPESPLKKPTALGKETSQQKENKKDKHNDKSKPKGHGRLSAKAYTGATDVVCT